MGPENLHGGGGGGDGGGGLLGGGGPADEGWQVIAKPPPAEASKTDQSKAERTIGLLLSSDWRAYLVEEGSP